MRKIILSILLSIGLFSNAYAQYSVARRWNEVNLAAVREDLARPPVQARTLYHVALAMYDAWAIYDKKASTMFLGKQLGNFVCPFDSIPTVASTDTVSSQEMALSYAAYRILKHRYNSSPTWYLSFYRFDTLMQNLGYDINYTDTNYQTGTPADLGNYLGAKIIEMGFTDNSHEIFDYDYLNYAPINPPLMVDSFGNPTMTNYNNWQPLEISNALDQGGNPIQSIQHFLCPEWGQVTPFAMDPTTATIHTKNGGDFPIYLDPGAPPTLNLTDVNDSLSLLFKWGHTMVATWSSHLDPDDTTMIDISPNKVGNVQLNPCTIQETMAYYKYFEGGDTSNGYSLNPYTGQPYVPNIVKRGDYTRVVSQFWADGPHSETPPGHWFVFLNYVSDHPLFVKQLQGIGDTLTNLEWDVKSYITLGGAMHDAAIATWGIKGWYDSPRPISALRLMGNFGQCSDSTLPHFHPAGLPLIPDYIEMVTAGDSLAGPNNEYVNALKIKTWRGFDFVPDPLNDIGHVGWVLAEKWTPYQRATFVTPPFAGYVSGHSTYSRAGAEALTSLTGNPFFPGGYGEYNIPANSGFLVFEKGPSQNINMQWATYQDASNEASLSRIWGGIHPPFDDIPGRLIGKEIGIAAFNKAKTYFSSNSILPIDLHTFIAVAKSCNVEIEWSTNSEQNLKSYTLLHSTDGKNFNRNVAEIVPSQNNSSSLNEYKLVDSKASQFNYYQLVENDLNNKSKIVATRFINMTQCFGKNNETLISLFPNPAKDQLNIQINGENSNSDAQIEIIDIVGKVVHSSKVKLNPSNSNSQIDIKSLPIGNYILKVSFEDGTQFVRKVTKY